MSPDHFPTAIVRLVMILGLGLASGCTPRVVLEAPKEPIVINMNVKIEHEVRVKVDKDLDTLFAEEGDVF